MMDGWILVDHLGQDRKRSAQSFPISVSRGSYLMLNAKTDVSLSLSIIVTKPLEFPSTSAPLIPTRNCISFLM